MMSIFGKHSGPAFCMNAVNNGDDISRELTGEIPLRSETNVEGTDAKT